MAHSLAHPKIVILMHQFEEVKFIERTVFPSYMTNISIDGYKLTKKRTGIQRILKNGTYSKHEWWICGLCKRKIRIGQPYAGKLDFSKIYGKEQLHINCRCISCYLDLIEEIHGLG
jgi:hypothetical protein